MKNTFWMGLTLLTASWACSSSSDPRENLEALSAEVAQYDTYEVSENYSARDARMRLESEYEYIEATVPHESESLVAITWELYRNGETSFMTGLYAPKNNFNPLTSNGVLKGRWVMYQDVDGDGDQEIILEDVTDYGPQAGGSFSLYSQDSESVYQPLGSAFGEWIYNGTKGYVDNVEIKIGEEDGRATISAEHYYTTEEMKTEPDEVEIYFYSE
ncbi:MAG TPA: hypothetical protein DCR93_16060, partial [Cytophagales bacterium]|nr:hypothetical protein [Cytophagales bacterium]